MAYHCSVKTISRSSGRSATAAAAYRASAIILDERTGLVHDYRRKRGVLLSEIVLPPGAPSWANDRSELWNAAEKSEVRKNSTVAREWEVLIPFELNREQAIDLVRDYSLAISDRHQVAIEFSIHRDNPLKWDGAKKGAQGLHGHILASTRRLTPEGFGQKSRELDAKGIGSSEVVRWRQEWERIGNMHLERAGLSPRLDHRSYVDQGLPFRAMPDLPPSVVVLERNGTPTDFGDKVRAILAENAKIMELAYMEALENVRAREEFRTATLKQISGNLRAADSARSETRSADQRLVDAIRESKRSCEATRGASRCLDESFEQNERIAQNWHARRNQEFVVRIGGELRESFGKASQLIGKLVARLLDIANKAVNLVKEQAKLVNDATSVAVLRSQTITPPSSKFPTESGSEVPSAATSKEKQNQKIADEFLKFKGISGSARIINNPPQRLSGVYIENFDGNHFVYITQNQIAIFQEGRLGDYQPVAGALVTVPGIPSQAKELLPQNLNIIKKKPFKP